MGARKTKAPTVRDVARRAGVSTSTISHVLNQTRFVSDDLREKVLTAMRELNYEPNMAARMLTLRRSNTIGLIVSDIQLADGSSGADAVMDILARHDIPVVVITAFPERLLTGERPEPSFIVTKPFQPGNVKAAVAQALFFHPRAARKAA